MIGEPFTEIDQMVVDDEETLTTALVKAQADMPALQRDKINPHFKSRYLSLETLLAEVLPVLNRHGLAVTQWPTYIETETGVLPALRTILMHGPSGEQMEDTMLLLATKQDAQGQGAAITYGKRYALMALCGLSADEDDDGNAASARKARAAAATSPRPVISDPQRRRLRAMQQECGVTDARLKELVKEHAGVDSSKLIPRDKYDALIAAVEAERGQVAA